MIISLLSFALLSTAQGGSAAEIDPTAVDVRVSAARTGLGPSAVVTVDVAGLGASRPGTLTVSADQLSASVQLDPRCDLVRVGFEDGIHLPDGTVARDNAEMVSAAVDIAKLYGAGPATVEEARARFGIAG